MNFVVNSSYRHFWAIFNQNFGNFFFRVVLEKRLDPLDRDVENQHGLLEPIQEGVAAGFGAETKFNLYLCGGKFQLVKWKVRLQRVTKKSEITVWRTSSHFLLLPRDKGPRRVSRERGGRGRRLHASFRKNLSTARISKVHTKINKKKRGLFWTGEKCLEPRIRLPYLRESLMVRQSWYQQLNVHLR